MLQSADADEQDRLQRFKLGWQVYDGDMHKPLKVELGQRDDNVIVPLARSFVNTSVQFLLGEDLIFKSEDDRVNEVVDATWSGGTGRSNTKMLTLNKLAVSGGVTGHLFLKLRPENGQIKLSVLDPSYVSILWSQEDIDVVRRYRIQWPMIDKDNRPAVRRQDHTKQDNGTWLIEDFISKAGAGEWQLIGKPEVWPYDFPAIVDGQNLPRAHEYWGQSDLEGGLIDINNAINAVLSDIKKILTFHASPKTIAEGMTPEQFDELNADPSALYFLPEGGDMRNLELSGDLTASIATYERLKSVLHQVASIPEVATGKVDNIGSLSARAMQILYKPLIDLTTTKQMTHGHVYDEVNRRACIISGIKDPILPDILWPEVLPKDALDDAAAYEADLRMGIVSKETVASKRGYDFDQESEKIAEEQKSEGESVLTNFDRGNTTGADAYAGQTSDRPVS